VSVPRPYIIAEAGSCHEEILERALALVQVAAEAGASAIKYQFWSDPARMRTRRHIADPTAYERGSIKETWFPPLRSAAHDLALDFIVTAFLPEDVDLVARHVDHFKVASFEHENRPLLYKVLHAVRGTERRIFYSTGLSNGQSASWSPRIPGHHPAPVITLHCVSAYPCPPDQANLGAIKRGHGYSDHTGVHFMGGLAVAAGADYLEIHCRLDETSADCPDYGHSLTPALLQQYVSFARAAYQIRGDGQRGVPQTAEMSNMPYKVTATAE
jgi:N,N'-diacetyllegionaminate synthase